MTELNRKPIVITLVLIILLLLLSACSPTTSPPATEEESVGESEAAPTAETTVGEAGEAGSAVEEANIDWRQFEGQELNILMVPHPYTEAFKAQLPEFEALTGMKVNVTAIPYRQAADRLLADLSSGQGQFDVAFSAYPWDWQLGQFYAPLDDFINNPELTDQEWYDVDDFMPLILESNRWDAVAGHELGEGPILSMPVMVETYILHYRKDLFEKHGVKVPETWDEYFEAAKALTQVEEDGTQTYGLMARGGQGIGTLMTNVINMYKAYGETDLNENLEPVFNSPTGVEITEKFIDTVQVASPPGWPDVFWDDALNRFAAGGYAMLFDVDFGAQTFENPETSAVAGKVAYALPPAGPEGRFSNIWAWGLAINEASDNPEAAWLLVQWATSKDVLKEATTEYRNFNPTRLSVWNDPDVIAMIEDWGDGTYRPVVEEVLTKYAKLRWTPQPQVSQMAAIWTEKLHEAYADQITVEEALNEAATEIGEMLEPYR